MMKNVHYILLLICLCSKNGNAQNPSNPINMLRYNDNFSHLKADTIKKGVDKLKYVSLGKRSTISFGGEIREQYQYFENQNFGDVPPTFSKVSVGQLWHRIMLHSHIELSSKTRIFVQFNSTFRFFNPNPLTPEIDENRLSLHQAFVDYSFNEKWMLRAGRQELGYGNNRILTFREGPNTRLTFDAVILKYKSEKRKIDLMAVTPIVSNPDVFDDTSFEEYVYGIYGTEYFIPKKLLADYYILGFNSDKRRYNFVAGIEKRQVFGTRIFSQNPKLNYEVEGTYQTGKFNQFSISAFGISGDLNYKIIPKLHLIVGLGANYISGDKNKNDSQLNTYNLIFSKPQYGLAAPIGSSNIININPYLKVMPIKKLSVYAGVYFMQRQSNQDGTYSPGMAEVRPTPTNLFTSTAREIGTQYAVETNLEINHHFSFAVDAAYFNAGQYVKETGNGKNITYLAGKVTLKF